MYIEKQLFNLILIKLTVASLVMLANFVHSIRKSEEINSSIWFSNSFCILTTCVLWLVCIFGGEGW